MRDHQGWERATRRIALSMVRRMSPSLAFAAIERIGSRHARMALRAGGSLLPREVRTFPVKVAGLRAGPLDRDESARLIEARLVFLLTRAVLTQVLLAHPQVESRRRLAPIRIDGAAHVEAALGEGRGAIIVSGHFGFPPLIRLVLEDLGVSVIGVGGGAAPGVDVSVGSDVWDRGRVLPRLRAHLAENRVCVLLADGPYGRYVEVPFLGGRIAVALGGFGLAQVTRSPLLTAFAVRSRGMQRFRVEIGQPLPLLGRSHADPPTEAIAEFARRYEAVARSHPCHLFAYDPLFGAGARHS